MIIVTAILAWIIGLIGSFYLTEATKGIGFIAMGCLLVLIARIAQAKQQHEAVMKDPCVGSADDKPWVGGGYERKSPPPPRRRKKS